METQKKSRLFGFFGTFFGFFAKNLFLWKGVGRTRRRNGSTNRLGEVPQDRPLHYQDVFATLDHQLGIDTNTVSIPDQPGNPQYLVDDWKAMPEVI